MSTYDIFNGDADGIFALRQLRLDQPREAILVTGVKRDITLVRGVHASAGDVLTILDISLHENRAALLDALAAGAHCTYFDHHFAGDIPVHPLLDAHIEYRPDTCTSLIVDAYLNGRHRAWALAAAFGDNLRDVAMRLGHASGFSIAQLSALDELGQLVNYNAYGASIEDLHFTPQELYAQLSRYADPLAFAAQEPSFQDLRAGYVDDLRRARAVAPIVDGPRHLAVQLPDARWSRRISGSIANALARENPTRASAVIVPQGGAYAVSIRAPQSGADGADALARQFASGGGRRGAAGINHLVSDELPRFLAAFQKSFQ